MIGRLGFDTWLCAIIEISPFTSYVVIKDEENSHRQDNEVLYHCIGQGFLSDGGALGATQRWV